jgi:serine/threonine-protein kinase
LDADRRRRIENLCHEALEQDGVARGEFVATACGTDHVLRREVEALLAHAQTAEGFLGTPLAAVAANALTNADRTSLLGRSLGAYQIHTRIGSGGMGEVYRAHDTRLGREVAIKVLPKAFTSDRERLARFEREARVLATFNHPNIAAIYGVEHADGVQALVLELVEGETLADRITRESVSVREALMIARQIAEALNAAHEKGIVHRDLKPANIKITREGVAKVLDFGLAKLATADGATADLAQSPTLTAGGTREGILLGTAAYMSPEQARGQAVDKRTDIWAFGCVLYEMLTGQRPFEGATITDTLTAIIGRDVDWAALPTETPAGIRRLLHRCLAKERRQRLSDAADARLEIEDSLNAPTVERLAAVPDRTARTWRLVAALAAAIAVGGLLVFMWMRAGPAPGQVARFTIVPSGAAAMTPDIPFWRVLAVSPDGTRVAYVGAKGALVVRSIDQLEPTILAGVEGARAPTFSPDGQWIAFFDATAVRKIRITGGPAVTVAPISGFPSGLSWGPNDTIVFPAPTGLVQVPASGGQPEILTTYDRNAGEVVFNFPQVLPGGRGVLFALAYALADGSPTHLGVLDLRTHERRILVRQAGSPHYVAPGYLTYTHNGSLFAVRFDLTRLQVVGAPVALVEGFLGGSAGAQVSVAANGTLAYLPEAAFARELVWVDRQGRKETLGAPSRLYEGVRLSPDGTTVAVFANDQHFDLWLFDLARRNFTRMTTHGALDLCPVWAPDGKRLFWMSGRSSVGGLDIFAQAADGTGTADLLTQNAKAKAPTGITPSGSHLLFHERAGAQMDLMLLALDGARSVTPLVATPFRESAGEISPDGSWLAYESDETGQLEIYVRPFPQVESGKWKVSTGGGIQPLWARSGRELFYRGLDGTVMGAQVQTVSGRLYSSPPTTLVRTRHFAEGMFYCRTYDVAPDGNRFLMIQERSDSSGASGPAIVVVQNWVEEVKRLVPGK